MATGTNSGKARGFAALPKEVQRKIAQAGGRAAHVNGACHVFTSEEAKAAGAKGGSIVAKDRDHMARIGRVGGRKAAANRRKAALAAAAKGEP